MDKMIDLQKKIVPELVEKLSERYRILRFIRLIQPIGRRTLAINLDLSERVLRAEVMHLRDQGLIQISSVGMTLTEEGTHVLIQLEDLMKEVFNLHALEEQLEDFLNIQKAIVVPGDSDEHSWVKDEIGRAAVIHIKENLNKENNKIAVTGGSTMSSVAKMMDTNDRLSASIFLSARGGLGERVDNQANTVCSTMAGKAKGEYKLLYLPDELSKDAYDSMIEEPAIKETLDLIRSSNMVIHGIGEAKTMAIRRNSSEDVLKKLKTKAAVAEAFGYYFNERGNIIHKVQTIGLKLDDLNEIPHIVAVAGGPSKAGAIGAYMKNGHSKVLITDEGAARSILNK